MKLFQKLLVAPAALGLLAPVASAADLNINEVSDYSPSTSRSTRVSSANRVKGFSQFSDVYPTDWAYQALTSMIERHGCSPISSQGALTRYEAAALLNNCLGNVAQANEEERRLINEFSPELAVIKGRLDGVEAGMSMSSPGFSTTTTIDGTVSWFLGVNDFYGKRIEAGTYPSNGLTAGQTGNEANEDKANYGGASFTYDVQLAVNTSFDGEDSLVTIIRSANATDLQTASASHSVGQFEAGFDSTNQFQTDKIYYQTPFGEDFTVTVGAKVGQEDMLAVWPTAYQSDATSTILNVTTLAGAPGAYNKNLGSGVGISWDNGNGISASANYISGDGGTADSSDGGFMTDGANGSTTVQLGYTKEQWGVAAIYSYLQDSTLIPTKTKFLQNKLGGTGDNGTDAYGISAYWLPEETGTFIPSVSAGYGWNTHDTDTNDYAEESSSWMVGLEWNDVPVFGEGNSAGIAYGSAVGATSMKGGASVDDDNTVFEAWYKHRVSDSIVVSPGFYVLDGPLGDNDAGTSRDYTQVGAVLRTTFTF